jgi:predicted metalloendopeptidase
MIKKNKTRKISQNDKDLICGTNVILYKSFQKQYTYKELLNFNNSTNKYYEGFNSYLKEPTPKPCDNFYQYVNAYWNKHNKITLNTYNTFDKIQEKVYDEIFEIYKELVEDFMEKDASTAPRAVQLLLIARFLERICDHATNIAEDVIYMVQAEVVRHHPEKLK